MGHVPSTGTWQVGPTDGPGPWTSQQSWPSGQQARPQQNEPPLHTFALQGAESQLVPLQKGCSPPQLTPHAPQFLMSLAVLTHTPSQHSRPTSHAGEHPPPEDEVDAEVDELELVDVDPPPEPELVDVVPEPPCPPCPVPVDVVLVPPAAPLLVVPLLVVPPLVAPDVLPVEPPAPPVVLVKDSPHPTSPMDTTPPTNPKSQSLMGNIVPAAGRRAALTAGPDPPAARHGTRARSPAHWAATSCRSGRSDRWRAPARRAGR